jgi:hypothetical protein
MKQFTLSALLMAGMLASSACERDAGSQPNPNAQQPPQSSSSRTSPGSEAGAPPPGAGAVQSAPPEARIAAQTAFDTADRDKDGKVDATEASSVPGLDFAAADADKNQSLNREEYMAAIALGRPRG